MRQTYGLRARGVWDLGGAYHPSAGLTPEVVFPLALDCEDVGGGARELLRLRIADALERRAELHDGHLSVVLWRAAHACGQLDG
jgi:hypothetical protein